MRLWEVREKDGYRDHRSHMGMREKSVEEAYECGFEDGYKEAMEEYGERSSYRSMRYKSHEEEPSYRTRRY